VLSCVGRGLCDGLITRAEESYRASNCMWLRNLNKAENKAQLWAVVLWGGIIKVNTPNDPKLVKLSTCSCSSTNFNVRYSSYSFMTSALDGGEWSASRPGRTLPLGKGSLVPIGQEAGWAREPVWTQRSDLVYVRYVLNTSCKWRTPYGCKICKEHVWRMYIIHIGEFFPLVYYCIYTCVSVRLKSPITLTVLKCMGEKLLGFVVAVF
jgi:hypothetical protein